MFLQKEKITRLSLKAMLYLICLTAIFGIQFNLLFSATPESNVTFTFPPTAVMHRKPSIIVINIDSLREDMFKPDTFPKTLFELHGVDKLASPCIQWKNHDSGSFQAEQGYAALYYSMYGATRNHFYVHKANKNIRSWPLEVLRSNNYYLHRITPYRYQFCWVMDEECDLYYRDFDTVDSPHDRSESAGDKEVLKKARGWIERRSNATSPFLLSLDLQDVHFPYKYIYDAELEYRYHEPSLTEEEVFDLRSRIDEIDDRTRSALRPKLINRAKNSMLHLDELLSSFLEDIRPILTTALLVLTSNHGELYMDSFSSKVIGHALEDGNDLQRKVPLVMCGPNDIMSELEVPETIVTSHQDIFPTILTACGSSLGEKWQEAIGTFSYAWQHSSGTFTKKGFAFSQYPWSLLKVIIFGNNRIIAKDAEVIETERLGDGGSLNDDEILQLELLASTFQFWTWPGLHGEHRESQVEDGFDDLENDTPKHYSEEGASLDYSLVWKNDHDRLISHVSPSLNLTWSHSPEAPFIADIISIGSNTRPEYMHSQAETWAQHISVRSFWGFTEREDHDQNCSQMSKMQVLQHVEVCTKFDGWKPSPGRFVRNGFTWNEGTSRKDPGWMCAQRRLARALGWLKLAYAKQDLPDFLVVVDVRTNLLTDIHAHSKLTHSICFRMTLFLTWYFLKRTQSAWA
jgi:hypothetical protein